MADRLAVVVRRGLLLAGTLLTLAGLVGILLYLVHPPPTQGEHEPAPLVLASVATPTVLAPLFPVTGPTAAQIQPDSSLLGPRSASEAAPPLTVTAVPEQVATAAPPPARAAVAWGKPGSLFDASSDRRPAGRLPSPPPPALSGPQPTPLPVPARHAALFSGGPPTRIVARTIGLDVPIVPVGWKMVGRGGRSVPAWVVPDRQAGWHNTSALPGQVGNTVLSGHRNLYNEVFRYLPDLKIGDSILVYVGAVPFEYRVSEMHVVQEVGVPDSVRQENARWIARTDDLRLTLVTCWPYEAPGNTHRLIVVARP